MASFAFTPPAVSVTPVPMGHAVSPTTLLTQMMVNVTIVQNDLMTQALLLDDVHGFLSSS